MLPWKKVGLAMMVLFGLATQGSSFLSAAVAKTRLNVVSTQGAVVRIPVSSPSMALAKTSGAARSPDPAGAIRAAATFPNLVDWAHRRLDEGKKKKKNKDKDEPKVDEDDVGDDNGDVDEGEAEKEAEGGTEEADEVSDDPSPGPTVKPTLSPTVRPSLRPSSRPSSLPPTFWPTLSPSPPPTFAPVANDDAVDLSPKPPKEENDKETQEQPTEGTEDDLAGGTEDEVDTEDEKKDATGPQGTTSGVPLTPFKVQLFLPLSMREEPVKFELLESITTEFLLSYLRLNLEEGTAEAKSLRLVMTEFSTPDGTSQIPRQRRLWRGSSSKSVILRDMPPGNPASGHVRTSVSANFLVLNPSQQENNSERTVVGNSQISLSLVQEDTSSEDQSVFMISITYEGDVYFLNEEDTTLPETLDIAIEQVSAFRDEKQEYLRALRTGGKDDEVLSSVVDVNTEFPNIKSPGSEDGNQPGDIQNTSNPSSGGGSDPIVIVSVLVGLVALGAAGLFAFYGLRRMRANRRRMRSRADNSKGHMDFGASPTKTSPDEEDDDDDDEDYDDNSSRMPNKSATSTISSKPSMAAAPHDQQPNEMETSQVSEDSSMEPPSPAVKVAAAILQEQSQRHARGQSTSRGGRVIGHSGSRSRSRSRGVGADSRPHVIAPGDDDIKSMLTFDSMDAYSLEGGNHSANNSVLAGEDSDNESGAIIPYGGHGALAVYSYDGISGNAAGLLNLNAMSQARMAVYAAGDASSSDGESGIDDGVASRTNITVHSGSDGGSQFTFSQIGGQSGGPASASSSMAPSMTATKMAAFSSSVPAPPGISASRTEDEADGIEVSIDGGIRGDLSDADAAAGAPVDDILDESDLAGIGVEPDEDDNEFRADTKMFDEDEEGSDLRDVLSSPATSRGASRSRSRSRSLMSRIFSGSRGGGTGQQQVQQQQPARAVTPNTQTTSSSLDSPPVHPATRSSGFEPAKEDVDKIMANTNAMMMSHRGGRGGNMSIPSRRVLDRAALDQEAEHDATTIPLDARSASEVPSDELNSRVPLPQLTSPPSYEEPPALIPRGQHHKSYNNHVTEEEDVESSAVLDDLNRLSNLLRARKRERRGTRGSSVTNSRSRSRVKGSPTSSSKEAASPPPPPPAATGFVSASASPKDSYRNRLV